MKISKKEKQRLTRLLVKAREESGLTQNQVSEKGLLSQSVLSKMENGDRRIDFLTLERLAKLYGKTLDYFKTLDDATPQTGILG
jgi:transcriptional regulator with XRE-family HTH domain